MEWLNSHVKAILAFAGRNKTPLAVLLGFSMLAGLWLWSMLPAPYNVRYLFNLVTRTPVYVCRDGVYSWSAVPSGACSGHGGVSRRFKAEE